MDLNSIPGGKLRSHRPSCTAPGDWMGEKKTNWKKSITIWLKESPWSDSNQDIESMTFVLFLNFSHSVVSDSLRPHEQHHTRLPYFSPSPSLLKLMSIESVLPSNHLILCHPLLLLLSIFPSIRVFSNQSVLHIRWPKYWHFSFSINPSNEYSGLMSLGLSGLISSKSKELSRVFITTIQSHQFFSTSLLYAPTLISVHDYWKTMGLTT